MSIKREYKEARSDIRSAKKMGCTYDIFIGVRKLEVVAAHANVHLFTIMKGIDDDCEFDAFNKRYVSFASQGRMSRIHRIRELTDIQRRYLTQ